MAKREFKLSVIIPVYNVEQYVSQCLESVISQTMSDIEIVCVEDCSTDNSADIVRKYAAQDPRIKIIQNECNQGLSASRNNGIKNSSGKYIMFCDSDDWYAPNMCEKLYNAVTTDNADLAICGTSVIYEANQEQKKSDDRYFAIPNDGTFNMTPDIRDNYSVCAWNKIFKREIIESHDVWFPAGLKYEDNFFFHAYCPWVRKIAFVKDELYNYRRRPNSIMNATFKKNAPFAIDYLKIAIRIWEYMDSHGLADDNYVYFWQHIFIPFFQFTMRHYNNHDAIFKMSRQFIKSEYTFGRLDMRHDRTLRMIATGTLNQSQKYLGGIIRIQERTSCKKIRLIGMCVWTVKYYPSQTKYSLCGLRIFKKYNRLKLPNASAINQLPIDDTQLLKFLRKLPRFTYIPNPGNIGDMLIAAATLQFFKRNNIKFNRFDGRKTLPCVVYGGGGIWTANYERDWIKNLDIFRRAKQIMILPSSFNNCQKLIDVLDERFIVFCRERRSYEYLKSANTRAQILLDHDMAFRLDALPIFRRIPDRGFDAAARVNWNKIPSRAYFMRTDCESAGKYKTDLDVSDLAFGASTSNPDWINFCAALMLTVVGTADRVVTDRLHVAVAGLLCGRDVYMLDNTYGKLSGVYEQSMKQYQNVHLCTELPEFSI